MLLCWNSRGTKEQQQLSRWVFELARSWLTYRASAGTMATRLAAWSCSLSLLQFGPGQEPNQRRMWTWAEKMWSASCLGFCSRRCREMGEGDKLIRKISRSENWQPEECVSSYWFKQFVISNLVQPTHSVGARLTLQYDLSEPVKG